MTINWRYYVKKVEEDVKLTVNDKIYVEDVLFACSAAGHGMTIHPPTHPFNQIFSMFPFL